MNIAVFIKSTTFHKGYGGLEIQNKAVCEELVKRGHEITVFSPKNEIGFEEKVETGVNYAFVESQYKKYLLSTINPNSWYKKSLKAFKKYHADEPFDLIISQSVAAESIIDNKKEVGIKVITIAHGTPLSEFKTFFKNISGLHDLYLLVRNTQYFIRQYFGRQRKCILNSDKVIAVSKYVKKALVEETFCPEERITVINNGIDPKDVLDYVNEENKSGPVRLYFLGRVEKSKGILNLIDILKGLKKDFVLHVVGDGLDLAKAKEKVEKYGMSNKVVFHGRFFYGDFIRQFKPDIFLFPTQRIEGFPMVLPEAMVAGIPVVAFNLGGVSDAVDDGKTGYLVEAGDDKIFTEKLEDLIDNGEKRKEFGRNAKEKALKDFTLDKMIGEYEKAFREVLT